MKNKTLSEQIFEACGVDTNKYGYPDFENNNNNSTKLLNTYTDYSIEKNNKIPSKPIWWVINTDARKYNQLAPYDIEICLIRLLLILKNENNEYSEKEINKIKAAIKNEQWEL